jgi:hypothetical protein
MAYLKTAGFCSTNLLGKKVFRLFEEIFFLRWRDGAPVEKLLTENDDERGIEPEPGFAGSREPAD